MKRIISLARTFTCRALYFTALMLLVSCAFEVDNTPTRTVLVYIAADNNLSGDAGYNIEHMKMAMSGSSVMEHMNLLVYVDRLKTNPALLHIHDHRADTIKAYDEKNSADASTLREVIDYVKREWPSDYYGLVLWSHGTGWLPESQLHYVAPNLGYVPIRRAHATKAFSKDYITVDGKQVAKWMEIEDLVEAIPNGMFDYILFDACYMGNVEIAYALRNKTKYIVSSCFEIVSTGFPYDRAAPYLLNSNLTQACMEFYSYYNRMTNWEQMAGISIVKTDGLDSLARCFKKVVADFRDSIPVMDVSKVQRFDRFNNHVFYDLEDFVHKLGPRKEYLNEFRLQLSECVQFKISTPYIFPKDEDSIKVNTYCGLSVYIPLEKYDAPGLNDDYRRTEWSERTNY